MNTKANLPVTHFVMFLSTALALSCGAYYTSELPYANEGFNSHLAVISGTAFSPYRYRVLIPFLAEGLVRLLNLTTDHYTAVLMAYAVSELMGLTSFILVLFFFLREWFSLQHATIGTLFTAALLPFSLREYYYQPWSMWEPTIITIGLLLIAHKRYFWLGILTVIATLNRETGIFLPISYGLIEIPWRQAFTKRSIPWPTLMRTGAYVMLWAVCFVGLRLLRGPAEPAIRLDILWNVNISSSIHALQNWAFFLGPFAFFVFRGFRYAPRLIQRAALYIPAYLALVIVYGVWYEIRLLIPLYPILIGAGLTGMFPEAREGWLPSGEVEAGVRHREAAG